ncbi:MAG: phosphatidylserine decarboxylase family protein [Paludibacteraceae bacterium]|nr:phosphatidylserine decarboxylase family protein [Paludibacteraceae bacterium]MBQ5774609.1 phosphatidylserine decarboxylase family protein [Paludibacteraceae bacterium]
MLMGKKKRHHRIHREGRKIILTVTFLIFAINVLVYLWISQSQMQWILAISVLLSAALLVFVTYFFRNPVRILEVQDPNFLIAPADGRVVVVEPTMENEYFHEKRLQVSIFMSPLNVHANWYPIEGTVIASEHQDGSHKGAWLPKSSTENERSLVVIETHNKALVAVRQIAGAMARRIVTYSKVGSKAHRNEHFGFIKFGSRVDLYLPLDTEIFVTVGEHVKGNETILGRINN